MRIFQLFIFKQKIDTYGRCLSMAFFFNFRHNRVKKTNTQSERKMFMWTAKKALGLILLLIPVFKYISDWKKEEEQRRLLNG